MKVYTISPRSRVGFVPAKTCFCQTCGLNWIKSVKNGKNQNSGIVRWYKGFLFSAAPVYYLKHANVLHINYQSSFSTKSYIC